MWDAKRKVYRLELSNDEVQALQFIGKRYEWSEYLLACLEGNVVMMTEREAWNWRDDVDSDDSPFPMASPSFAQKLSDFYWEVI